MTREELQREVLDYLRENLTIRTVVRDFSCYAEGAYVEVSIALDGEVISSDTFDMPKEGA
jgi:hypothetical protein